MASPYPIPTRQNFGDVELGQCKVRLAIGVAGGSWYFFWLLYAHSSHAAQGLEILGGYFAYAILHWCWVRKKPGFNPWRMYIVTIADQAVSISLMFFTQELGYFFVFANPWISTGNGLRFGKKWMLLSATVAITGLMVIGLYSNYWQDNLILLMGLVILNATIPAYVLMLLNGLEESRKQLSIYAKKMENMALNDKLTGLPNRPALFAEFKRIVSFSDRNNMVIALLYFDLDGFKKVNDTYGHSVGDILLKETAIRVSNVLRKKDMLARLGGDEFVVLLHGESSVERANLVANRILQTISSIKSIRGDKVDITASVGGIVARGLEATDFKAEALLHEADQNMYKAKKAGKNQIVFTGLSDETHVPETALNFRDTTNLVSESQQI